MGNGLEAKIESGFASSLRNIARKKWSHLMPGGTFLRYYFDDLPKEANAERSLPVIVGVLAEVGKVSVIYAFGKTLQLY